jgi:hypothetical protein
MLSTVERNEQKGDVENCLPLMNTHSFAGLATISGFGAAARYHL